MGTSPRDLTAQHTGWLGRGVLSTVTQLLTTTVPALYRVLLLEASLLLPLAQGSSDGPSTPHAPTSRDGGVSKMWRAGGGTRMLCFPSCFEGVAFEDL